jgi:glycosyltransferase involved in cell wall biosynthesis
VDFEWNVYGTTESSSIVRFFSRRYNIAPNTVNVNLLGYVDGATIMQGLLKSDVYVHPSYIENGCNAIQESMLLGLPVIAHCTGGLTTTLKDKSGVLVQPNDSSVMAHAILQMRDQSIAEYYSLRGRNTAIARNDRNKVVKDLLTAYKSIINEKH